MCEFGCGPGLPSLTAASVIKRVSSGSGRYRTSLKRVVATDVDPVALELVERAAIEQGLDSILTAQPFDLMGDADTTSPVPQADLYLLADVFESSHVARGAAHITSQLLLDDRGRAPCQVWVFAQSDRAQREVYLDEIKRLLQVESLAWSPVESGPPSLVPPSKALQRHRPSSRLWLCDVDETRVKY
jgi:predicted nicotinamide N-methyase